MENQSRSVEELRHLLAERFGETKETYLETQRPDPELLELLREMIALNPLDWSARAKLFDGLYKAGEPGEALAVVEGGLSSVDDLTEERKLNKYVTVSWLLNWRAILLWDVHRKEEAIDQARAALQVKYTPYHQEELVKRLHELGRHEEVIEEVSALAGLIESGMHPDAALCAGLSCKELGDKDAAVRFLWQAACAGAELRSVNEVLRSLGRRVVVKGENIVLKKRGWFG